MNGMERRIIEQPSNETATSGGHLVRLADTSAVNLTLLIAFLNRDER
jgi:hypothetical protein